MSDQKIASEKVATDSGSDVHAVEPGVQPGSLLKPTFEDYVRLAEKTRIREKEHGTLADLPDVKHHHESEMETANRALRTAGWISIFYLITTDILGPFNAPFAFSQVGYVPGVILYVVMGGVACYTGLILWRLFLQLDSAEYPIKTYSDLFERIFGKSSGTVHMSTILQSLQLIVNVGTICLANGQAVEQIAANHKFCFTVAILIWALFGMIIGQIRSLKAYGWLANSAVWMNLIIIFTSMGFVAHSPPNFASAMAAYGISPGPIIKQNFVPLPLFDKVNGIMNMVFAYGGAMIFPEFMAEMRRPMDFWKGMVCAQLLISIVYLMYGVFVYAFQGQYTLPLAFQGVSKQSWQDVGNVLGLITGIIAAGLYGNIGIKVAYYNIVEGWFNGPSLLSPKGRLIWTPMVILYWALAFIIGTAIPQVQTISGLIAAVCIMQFTYTFPPLLLFGFNMRVNAMGLANGKGDPGDSWFSISRWRRGIFGGDKWYMNVFNFILFLASAALACLGMYGSGKAIQATFQSGAAATSFGCHSPV